MNIVYYLSAWGVLDLLIPFLILGILIFTLFRLVNLFVFAKIWKKFKLWALILFSAFLSLIIVFPHILGFYGYRFDPVVFINSALPFMVSFVFFCGLIHLGLYFLQKEDVA